MTAHFLTPQSNFLRSDIEILQCIGRFLQDIRSAAKVAQEIEEHFDDANPEVPEKLRRKIELLARNLHDPRTSIAITSQPRSEK